MSELTEFLLARIAEDERAFPHYEHCGVRYWECDCSFPDQWERECEAKRRIVEAVDVLTGGEKTYMERMEHTDVEDSRYVIARDMLAHLATVYADHPDYRPEWKL